MEWQKQYIISVCFWRKTFEENLIINLHTLTRCCIHNFLHHIISCHIICQPEPCIFTSAKALNLTFSTVKIDFVKDTPSNINLWCRAFLYKCARNTRSQNHPSTHTELISTNYNLTALIHVSIFPFLSFSLSLSFISFSMWTLICNSNVITFYNFPNICELSIYKIGNEKDARINCINIMIWLFGCENWIWNHFCFSFSVSDIS